MLCFFAKIFIILVSAAFNYNCCGWLFCCASTCPSTSCTWLAPAPCPLSDFGADPEPSVVASKLHFHAQLHGRRKLKRIASHRIQHLQFLASNSFTLTFSSSASASASSSLLSSSSSSLAVNVQFFLFFFFVQFGFGPLFWLAGWLSVWLVNCPDSFSFHDHYFDYSTEDPESSNSASAWSLAKHFSC